MTHQPDIKVLILTGPAGSGKSEVARHVKHEHSFDPLKFAGLLKDMLYTLGAGTDMIEGTLKNTPCDFFGGRTPRHAMQTLGTEWGRNMIHPDIWALAAAALLEDKAGCLYSKGKFVFDDGRFGNEIHVMQERFNTRVINLVPSYPEYVPIEASGHASEAQELHWDVQIHNSGDVAKLLGDVDHALESIWL